MKPVELAVLVLLAALWGLRFCSSGWLHLMSPFWVVEGRGLVSLGLLLSFSSILLVNEIRLGRSRA
jgi:hypothetical protein